MRIYQEISESIHIAIRPALIIRAELTAIAMTGATAAIKILQGQ